MSDKPKALVTGGTRGIGRAIAEQLSTAGMDVYVTGTTEASEAPQRCQRLVVDFLNDDSTSNFLADIAGRDFEVVVNNAGINKIGEFDQIALDDFQNIQKVNLQTPFQIIQAVLPTMKKAGYGRIVNITSIFGHISKEYRAPYSASKFGVDGMTTALSAEVAEFGILANSVGPGFIDTDLTRRVLGEEGIKQLQSRIPMKRLGKPEEIAKLVGFLVSSDNTYLTGQNIIIDGGFSRV